MLKESDILKGIDFKNELRFSINFLRIWYNNEFQGIPEFDSGMQSLGDPITLKYVLYLNNSIGSRKSRILQNMRNVVRKENKTKGIRLLERSCTGAFTDCFSIQMI